VQRRLVVSTECPECGAPLDFSEGSNAVRCDYCRSNLLVTGRKQVLSYYVAPKIDPREAARIAFAACRERGARRRATAWERYFIPYYRFTGHDLRWERGGKRPGEREQSDGAKLRREHAAMELACAAGIARSAPGALHRGGPRRTAVLRDRYADKNFIAAALDEPALYSLGIRLAVLKLRLFNGSAVRELGCVAAPAMDARDATAHAVETVRLKSEILRRKVLRPILSVIYFPFCLVGMEGGDGRSFAVIDGVAGGVARLDAPAAIKEALDGKPESEPDSITFRPLACPNCGWDLPLRPDDAVFYCRSCDRTFEIRGHDLRPVPHEIAAIPEATSAGNVRHLPFWVLSDPERAGHPARFFVPAFRFRRLKSLVDLARDMSGEDRAYRRRAGDSPDLAGCYYDRDDANALADAAYPGLAPDPLAGIAELDRAPLRFRTRVLTWIPFHRERRSLRDPFTGRALDQGLLL